MGCTLWTKLGNGLGGNAGVITMFDVTENANVE